MNGVCCDWPKRLQAPFSLFLVFFEEVQKKGGVCMRVEGRTVYACVDAYTHMHRWQLLSEASEW